MDPPEEFEIPVEEVDPIELLTPAEKAVYDKGPLELRTYLDNSTSSAYLKRVLLSLEHIENPLSALGF